MLIGNIGIISALASLMLTFVNANGNKMANIIRLLIITGNLMRLWLLSSSKWVVNLLVRLIYKALIRFTTLDIKDYVEFFNLKNE
ncbi:MAG TPA: hypothetical protein VK982_03810 [Bacteroidales bacterium]|nr:hypothetical protein [Bacteroidales bacterium]